MARRKRFEHIRSWDDWADFVRDIQAPGASNANTSSTSDGREHSWDYGAGWSGAVDMGEHGWAEGRKRFIEGIAFAPHITELGAAPSRAYGVVGSRASIGRIVAGSPSPMVKKGEDVTGGRPIVRLLVSITASAGVDAETIENRGIAICSCIDQLESLGYQFEVIAYDGLATSENIGEWFITIKRAGAPLDVDVMAFALAHPAMLRRFMFRAREQVTEFWPDISGGYGSIKEAKPEHGQIYFPSLHMHEAYKYDSRGEAVDYVARVISEGAGIEYDGREWYETDKDDSERA